jgi:hypothetical protein
MLLSFDGAESMDSGLIALSAGPTELTVGKLFIAESVQMNDLRARPRGSCIARRPVHTPAKRMGEVR